jgi:hypothetical protein
MAKGDACSGGRRPSFVNKYLFGRVTHLFDHFLNLWDEQRRNHELTRRYMEPWHEDSINVMSKQR